MARDAHSASSIALGAACRHAWALRYIDGFREPELSWAQITSGLPHTSRQRSLALGKELHRLAEKYLSGRALTSVEWASHPGQVFQSGVHLLPERGQGVMTEVPLCGVPGDDPPPVEIDGVKWAGLIDVLVCRGRGAPQIWDHKSCSNIDEYALTPESLALDLQACIYAIAVCNRFGVNSVSAHWVYYETKAKRRAERISTVIYEGEAIRVVSEAAALARELDAYATSAEAPRNTGACLDYGGRPCHRTQGGPCDARIPVKLLASRGGRPLNRSLIMPLDEETKNKFAAARAKFAKTPAAAPEAPPEAPAPAPATRAKRGRSKGSKAGAKGAKGANGAKPAAAPVAPAALDETYQELVQVCTEIEALEARKAELKEAVVEQLGSL